MSNENGRAPQYTILFSPTTSSAVFTFTHTFGRGRVKLHIFDKHTDQAIKIYSSTASVVLYYHKH